MICNATIREALYKGEPPYFYRPARFPTTLFLSYSDAPMQLVYSHLPNLTNLMCDGCLMVL